MSEAAESAVSGDLYTDETLQAFVALFGNPAEDESGTDWMESSLCSQTDPRMFFPEKGDSTREAKQLCLRCPVRANCEDYVMRRLEQGYKEHGIWAGMSPEQREKKLADRGVRRRRWRRSPVVDADIVRARRAGVSADVVAARVGVCERTVERAVARNRQAA